MKKWKIMENEKYEKRIRDLTWAISFADFYSAIFEITDDEDRKTESAKNFLGYLESVKWSDSTAYRTLTKHVYNKRIPEAKNG